MDNIVSIIVSVYHVVYIKKNILILCIIKNIVVHDSSSEPFLAVECTASQCPSCKGVDTMERAAGAHRPSANNIIIINDCVQELLIPMWNDVEMLCKIFIIL